MRLSLGDGLQDRAWMHAGMRCARPDPHAGSTPGTPRGASYHHVDGHH